MVSRRRTQRRGHAARSARAILRFLAATVGLLSLFFFLLTQVRFFDTHVIQPYTLILARSMTAVLHAVGSSPVISGTQIYAAGFTATIVPSCAGFEIMAMLAAAILAFPAPVWRKCAGVGWGLLAVHVINVARLVVLFLVGMHFRTSFDQAHYFYAQGFLLLAAVGVWALWASRLPRSENAHGN